MIYKLFHCGFKYTYSLYVYICIYPQNTTQIKVQNVFGPLEVQIPFRIEHTPFTVRKPDLESVMLASWLKCQDFCTCLLVEYSLFSLVSKYSICS